MEEDIKILEKFTNIVKGKNYNAKNGWHAYYDDELIVLGKAIENLIKEFKKIKIENIKYKLGQTPDTTEDYKTLKKELEKWKKI